MELAQGQQLQVPKPANSQQAVASTAPQTAIDSTAVMIPGQSFQQPPSQQQPAQQNQQPGAQQQHRDIIQQAQRPLAPISPLQPEKQAQGQTAQIIMQQQPQIPHQPSNQTQPQQIVTHSFASASQQQAQPGNNQQAVAGTAPQTAIDSTAVMIPDQNFQQPPSQQQPAQQNQQPGAQQQPNIILNINMNVLQNQQQQQYQQQRPPRRIYITENEYYGVVVGRDLVTGEWLCPLEDVNHPERPCIYRTPRGHNLKLHIGGTHGFNNN